MSIKSAHKGGRCHNGSHKDRGIIIHLVPHNNEGVGDWFCKAMCGAEPGNRSFGWSETSLPVNCKKCLDKFTN